MTTTDRFRILKKLLLICAIEMMTGNKAGNANAKGATLQLPDAFHPPQVPI